MDTIARPGTREIKFWRRGDLPGHKAGAGLELKSSLLLHPSTPPTPCTQNSRVSRDRGRDAGHTCHHAQHAPPTGRKLGAQLGTPECSAGKASSILQPSFAPVCFSSTSVCWVAEARSYLSCQVWTPLERGGLPPPGPSAGSAAPPRRPPCHCPGSRSAALCLTLCLQPPGRKCFLLPVA